MFSRDGADKVVYFGSWAHDSAPARLQRNVLAVLADAERCAEEDMRTSGVIEALAFLGSGPQQLHLARG